MADSRYSDLTRPPLSEVALRRALVRPGELWTQVQVVQRTGSTNADLVAAATGGAPEGAVLVAEKQDAGRGRLGRVWTSPPRAGLHVSVLLRPGRESSGRPPLPAARYGWLPLLAGLALVGTVRRLARVEAALKWPNDLLVAPGNGPDVGSAGVRDDDSGSVVGRDADADTAVGQDGDTGSAADCGAGPGGPAVPSRKCAGILAEAVPDPGGSAPAVVLGIGLNVTLRADELPRADATSLELVGGSCTDRDPLLRGLLRELASWYERFRAAAGDPVGSGLAAGYRAGCVTLGRTVRVELPGGKLLTGTATDIDADGRLLVTPADGVPVALAAGDVTHVR